MNVSVKYCGEPIEQQGALKCRFADLKYEQLLQEKYFVETCMSKENESYSPKDRLIDIYFKIKLK